MVDLREKLMINMRISESTKKHFRKKLEKKFGDLLKFEDLLNNNKLFVLIKKKSFKGSTGQRCGKVISAIRQRVYVI